MESAQQHLVYVFGAILGSCDAGAIHEIPKKLQEFGSLSSKAKELPSSSSSSTSKFSSQAKTLSPSPTPTSTLYLGLNSARSKTTCDESRESPEIDSQVRFDNAPTLLSLFPVTADHENPKKRKRTDGSAGHGVAENPLVEELETARNIARLKVQSREAKEEERRKGVSTELTLFSDPWMIKKELKPSDLSHLSRLLLPVSLVEDHILGYLPFNDVNTVKHAPEGLSVSVLDHDSGTSHRLRLKFWPSSKSYVLIGGWRKDFVLRKRLSEQDEIGLFWDQYASKLHFRVLRRAAAEPLRAVFA